MCMRYILVFFGSVFAFLLFSGMGFASQIADHTVLVDIDGENTAHFDVGVTFVELTTERINYLVFAHIDNARGSDVLGELECVVEKQTYGAQISCAPNSKMRENYTVEMSFDSYGLVRKSGDAELFSYSYGVKDPTANFALTILLPEGASLLSAEDFDPFFPEGAVIGTEMGRRVSLEWDVLKPELGRTYTFDSYFEFVGKLPDAVEPIDDTGDGQDDGLLFAAGVVIVVVMLLYYFRRRSGRRGAGVKRVFSVLKGDERRVIDVILMKGDKCKQRDIVRATDYSKAKVSRIMTELEARGILSRERIGRTNRVVLSENIDKKTDKSDSE